MEWSSDITPVVDALGILRQPETIGESKFTETIFEPLLGLTDLTSPHPTPPHTSEVQREHIVIIVSACKELPVKV